MIEEPVSKPSVMPSVNPDGTSRLNIRQDKTRQDNKAGFGSKNQNQNPPNLLASQPYERVCFSWFFSLPRTSLKRFLASAETLSTSYQHSFPQTEEEFYCSMKTGSNSRLVLSAASSGPKTGSGPSSNTSSATGSPQKPSASSGIGSTSPAGDAASFARTAIAALFPSRSCYDAASCCADRPCLAGHRRGDLRGVLVGVEPTRRDRLAARDHGDIGAVELMEVVS